MTRQKIDLANGHAYEMDMRKLKRSLFSTNLSELNVEN